MNLGILFIGYGVVALVLAGSALLAGVLGPIKPIKVYAPDESYDFTSGPALVWDRTSGIAWWSSRKHLAAHLKLLRTYEESHD